MTQNEKLMLDVLQRLIKAKNDAENDECYSLNEGIHLNEINDAFEEARKVVAVVSAQE